MFDTEADKSGLDLAYRCHRCGKIVLRYHIQNHPHRCTKCGSLKVVPIMRDLTKFGILWCRFWEFLYEKMNKHE